jgi:hypothetical protein
MYSNMTKPKKVIYQVEGHDWATDVEIDTDIFEGEKEQLFEAGTRAIEFEMKDREELNIGAILCVKRKRSKKEAFVNSYICLNNAGQYKLAEILKDSFKKQSGQDLSLDTIGYSYE